MATATLKLAGKSSGADALIEYALRGGDNMSAQYYGINSDDNLTEPRLIDVKLKLKAPGLTLVNDRVETSFKHTVLDSDQNATTGSITIGISIPRSSAWTTEKTVSMLKQMADYLGGVSATVSGQTDTSGFPTKWAEALIP